MATKVSKSPHLKEDHQRLKALETADTADEANITTLQTQMALRATQSQVATYDFAVDGGAVSVISSSVTIPDKCVITLVLIDIITAITSTGGTGTIALTANSSGDLLAAVDGDTLSGIVAGIPVGTAATSVKTTAARNIKFAIATAALTAGKFKVYIEYFQSA